MRIKLITNVSTGEVTEVPFTPEEEAERDLEEAAHLASVGTAPTPTEKLERMLSAYGLTKTELQDELKGPVK